MAGILAVIEPAQKTACSLLHRVGVSLRTAQHEKQSDDFRAGFLHTGGAQSSLSLPSTQCSGSVDGKSHGTAPGLHTPCHSRGTSSSYATVRPLQTTKSHKQIHTSILQGRKMSS